MISTCPARHLNFPQFYHEEGTRAVQVEDFVMPEEDEESGDDPEDSILEVPAVATLPNETSQK